VSVEALSFWVIKQLVDFASKPARRRASELIFGDPLQRALRNPTKIALIAAVDAILGEDASPAAQERAFDVLGRFWNDDLNIMSRSADIISVSGEIISVSGDVIPVSADATITEALYSIVASGIKKANTPIEGLSAEFLPTTSLTSLSDELGIPQIDAYTFAAAFISEWLKVIHFESLTNHDLQQLAQLLAHEQTQYQIKQMRLGNEERLIETVWAAVQSLYDQILSDGDLSVDRRREWFDLHVDPAHQLMGEIAADYQSGFGETLDALRSGLGLEETMQRLETLRRRKAFTRSSLEVIARKLRADPVLFGASLDGALLKYVEAAEAFKRSDSPLNQTWYTHYIETFNDLIDRGQDPHLRENYPGIAGVVDLQGQLAVPLAIVVDVRLPQKWAEYFEAYVDLRDACAVGPPQEQPPPKPPKPQIQRQPSPDELLRNVLRSRLGY
jgi:hypothetical protein